MTPLLLIRHGRTGWNAEGRIQGQADIALSADGRAEVARWSVPREFRDYDWVASPLARAMETARLLGVADTHLDPRLMEMNWGEWEGRTLAELRAANGVSMANNEARGLDFRPPGGESPRAVQMRFSEWIADVAARGRPVAAITHKGVIRAALAIATGWDMASKPPHRLDWSRAHLFRVDGDGGLMVDRLNITLVRP